MEKTIVPRFRGMMGECLAHYATTLPAANGKGKREVFRPLAEFTNSSVLTAYRWTKGVQSLVGLRLIKTRYFLERLGYIVIELENLPPMVRDVGRLIAHNLFTVEEACRELSFSRPDHFVRLLRGGRKSSPKRMTKIQEIVKAYQPLLDEKGKDFSELYALTTSPVGPEDSDSFPAPPQAVKDDAAANPEHAAVLQVLAKNLEIVLPLAELVLTDVYTPDERRELRKHVNIFRVSNALHRLCGEMARAQKPVRWHGKTFANPEQ